MTGKGVFLFERSINILKSEQIGVCISFVKVNKHVLKFFWAVIFACLIFLEHAQATYQKPDALIYKNQTYELNTPTPNKKLPLDFLEKGNPLFVLIQHKAMISSGCWRNYVASWAVEEETLFLKSVQLCPEDKNIQLKDIFPDNNADKIKANWFSGTLILKNKQESISLEIQNGVVLSEGH